MRKSLILCLMALYILGATEAYQLLKLPHLFQHYKTHQQINREIGFSEFIDMHYFTVQTYDNDYQQDMQLPFKTSNRTISLLNFISLFAPKPFFLKPIEFRSVHQFIVSNDDKRLFNRLYTIFQPPR